MIGEWKVSSRASVDRIRTYNAGIPIEEGIEMTVNLSGRSFLKLLDFTSEEIAGLVDLAAELKRMKHAGEPHRYLEGKNIVLLFEKTSTRTRCSFEVA